MDLWSNEVYGSMIKIRCEKRKGRDDVVMICGSSDLVETGLSPMAKERNDDKDN